jgi:2'-5' RNA ligase
MYKNFLSTPQTVPCRDHDFLEWHNGISHYGFWAVVINDLNWIAAWNAAHAHIKEFIHAGYQRTPHVTIMACGLFDQNHFSAECLEEQFRVLGEMAIPPFYLRITSLNSFTTVPCLMVEDSTGSLKQIRERLTTVCEEDVPVQFQPHITLGLYRDAFNTVEVAKCLANFRCPPTRPVLVTELSFCVYETKEIQSQFKTTRRVKLNIRPAVRSGL